MEANHMTKDQEIEELAKLHYEIEIECHERIPLGGWRKWEIISQSERNRHIECATGLLDEGYRRQSQELVPLSIEPIAKYFYDGYIRDCLAMESLSSAKFDLWENLGQEDKMRMCFIKAAENFCA